MELVGFEGMKTRDGCITYFFLSIKNLVCSWLEKKLFALEIFSVQQLRINYYLYNIKKTTNKRGRIILVEYYV